MASLDDDRDALSGRRSDRDPCVCHKYYPYEYYYPYFYWDPRWQEQWQPEHYSPLLPVYVLDEWGIPHVYYDSGRDVMPIRRERREKHKHVKDARDTRDTTRDTHAREANTDASDRTHRKTSPQLSTDGQTMAATETSVDDTENPGSYKSTARSATPATGSTSHATPGSKPKLRVTFADPESSSEPVLTRNRVELQSILKPSVEPDHADQDV